MKQKNDLLWKGILEDVFDDFLRFMHPEADSIFDLSRGFIFLDKELEQLFPPEEDRYSPKLVDKLVRVYTRAGREEWILIHVEVQGQYRQDFGRRMFTYYYRILDKYDKPVAAYAIVTEPYAAEGADTFRQECLGTELRYRYNIYSVASQNEKMLLSGDNPFALVVLTAKAALSGRHIKDSRERDEVLLEEKLHLARELLGRKMSKDKVRVLMNFLRYYIHFENQNINHIFEEAIQKLTGRNHTMGIEELLLETARQEGIEKGIEKTKRLTVRNLIDKLGLSDEQAAEIAEVTPAFVKKVRASLKKKK